MNKAKQLKWDKRYIELGKLLYTWSDDEATQTSAIIVDRSYKLISIGYNGFPRGVKHLSERQLRPDKYDYMAHGEENAIGNTNQNLEGCTLYSICSRPLAPCSSCVRLMIQRGIKRVVCHKINSNDEKWNKSNEHGLLMLQENNIEIVYVEDIIPDFWDNIIKPCPNCGNNIPEIERCSDNNNLPYAYPNSYHVICLNCNRKGLAAYNIEGIEATKLDAIRNWNNI